MQNVGRRKQIIASIFITLRVKNHLHVSVVLNKHIFKTSACYLDKKSDKAKEAVNILNFIVDYLDPQPLSCTFRKMSCQKSQLLFTGALGGVQITFSDFGGSVLIAKAVDKQHYGGLYKIVQKISSEKKRSDQPFGTDEFPEATLFTEYAESGFVLAFEVEELQKVIGYGFITPFVLNRLPRPIYAEVRVVTLHGHPSIDLLTKLQGSLVSVCKEIGYVGCVIDTFTCNLRCVEAATCNGFRNSFVVPLSASNIDSGLCDSIILLKNMITDAKVIEWVQLASYTI